ncbi:MAG: Ig-like domain-containing protein [Spirochaetaceae bacterium]|jgi:hypothetical protein|nr:Ig-like domain-containing protein [Spirochaetaceae bacterium]
MKIFGLRITPVLCLVTLVVSCGIDDNKYLSPASLVSSMLNSNAVVRLPDGSTLTIDFTNGQIPTLTVPSSMEFGREYEIYYRIYLSDKVMETVNTDSAREDVNPTLATDWTAMYNYTVDSNNLSGGVASLFTNRKYYALQLGSSNRAIRSTGNGAFDPKPADHLFTTSDDLFNSEYLTNSVNADVTAAKSGVTPSYAYASMYVVIRDFNPQTLNPVYSSITFVNIFLLPFGTNLQNIPVTGVTVSPVSPQLTPNVAVKLRANVTPDNASDKTIVWSVDDESAAGVSPLPDNNAIVYSKAAGPNTVQVTAKTTDGGHSFTISGISLSGIAATGVELNKTQLTLSINSNTVSGVTYQKTEILTATVSPANADNKNVIWSSSDPGIATVDEYGEVTAVALGTVTITATTKDGTERVRACTVTVIN